jgi:hypothetical protein
MNEERVARIRSELGLGSKIERIAKPIAKVIDKTTRSNIANCGSCGKMRDRLNAGMTFSESIRLRFIEAKMRKWSARRADLLELVDIRLKSDGR